MKKIETIWHYLLNKAILEKSYKSTQQDVAVQLGYSLSTVNHALRIPSQIGAIRKETKFFVLADFTKLLYYWASIRNIVKDTIYSTFTECSVKEIEGLALPNSIYGGYSAASHLLLEPPADYDKVHFYLAPDDLSKLEDRFGPSHSKRVHNVSALRMPPDMLRDGDDTTLIQTFVDIWNLPDWYGQDFQLALKEKIDELLS